MYMKKELLSPVGNKESLLAAIHNGCDAVYLGGKKFGARAFADNFSEEELIWAIKYCHLYGVKIYVTVNTMIYESEMEECIDYLRFLHQNNVDAVILQDLGLITLAHEKFPNLEIHASTQMHTHNEEQLKLLESLGIKRVVLARELSLEKIKSLDTNMEIEAFIHGALCISYSGQCLFSSLLMNRSGNRGACAGICRLPFTLMKNDTVVKTKGNYLLSTKEFSTLEYFEKIMKSNIYSFKIEGRMKSPAYIGFVTHLYRTLIDNYNENKSLEIKEETLEKLQVLYNRGFTKGHLFGAEDQDLVNLESSNHQGIFLGEILDITKHKIKIKLARDIHQEDGIRFVPENKGLMVNFLYNEKGMLVNSAEKREIVFVDNKIGLEKKGTVLKTIDAVLTKEMQTLSYKKIPITCEVIAKLGKPLSISFSDGENKVEETGPVVEEAQNNPTSHDVIQEKLSSLGNSPFVMKDIKINKSENSFVPMSLLKTMRRNLEEKLIFTREEKRVLSFVEKESKDYDKCASDCASSIFVNVLVRNEEQLLECLKHSLSAIYVTDASLYEKYKTSGNVYLRISRVQNQFKDYKKEKLLVGETGSLYKYGKENTVVGDYYLNVANAACFSYLASLGAKRITLSIENNLEQIKMLSEKIKEKEKIEVFVYGKPEAMVMKYCPLKMLVNEEKVCHVCSSHDEYYLKDRNQKLYPILTSPEEGHISHLLYYKELSLLDKIKDLQNMGISNFRIELFDETVEEIKSILCKIL